MKVSVVIVTYNHERYISRAIDGVLMQKTDFPFEIVIGEDHSTDATADILVGYRDRFPDKFHLLLQARNLGINPNFIATLGAAKGEYIALLEGDDYWTDRDKLAKQVEFLDRHPDYASCFHNVREVADDGSRPSRLAQPPNQPRTSELDDILYDLFIQTSSTMFRRALFTVPDWFSQLPAFDWALHVLNAEHGKIGYLDEVMGVYRIHPTSTYSSLDLAGQYQAAIEYGEKLNDFLDHRHDKPLRAGISRLFYLQTSAYQQGDDMAAARRSARRCVAICPLNRRLSVRQQYGQLLQVHAPALQSLVRATARVITRSVRDAGTVERIGRASDK
jgi:glycosyltransferase involved in cell wall biosynthesis